MSNPKQEGTDLWSCRSQTGLCPNKCNQCYYNRPGAYYCDVNEPQLPDPDIVGDGIVRVNAGHDSNIERELAIEQASRYKNYFFNTSIPNFDFPAPVVYTANREEELPPRSHSYPPNIVPANLMFVRLRVSASNLDKMLSLITSWVLADVPVVLTFMAYYEDEELECVKRFSHPYLSTVDTLYEKKVHVKNTYWCATEQMKRAVCEILQVGRNRLLSMCGTITSSRCKDCMNCVSHYWITKRRMDTIQQLGR